MKASDNPSLQKETPDPTIFCSGFKKNRFYIFSTREPDLGSVEFTYMYFFMWFVFLR